MSYFSYRQYLQDTFGSKVYKVVITSGLTCPTRDGTLARTGCGFCDLRGSSSYYGHQNPTQSIHAQIQRQLPKIQKRFGATRFLAYFQSYTNTYSKNLNQLRRLYLEALDHPDISGLCISTRPDCLPEKVLDLLEELAQTTYISLELGIQSFHDPTLTWLQRGHNSACNIAALQQLKIRAPHVHVCAHVIFGCPTDPKNLPRTTAQIFNQIGVHGVKLHQLMILENTILGDLWRTQPFPVPTLTEYSETIHEFLSFLSPKIYIERLYATASHPEECLAPTWSRERWKSHNTLQHFLTQRNCAQGSALHHADISLT